MAEGNHIAVDIWTVRVTSQTSRKLQLVSYLVVAISCAMLFVGGLRFVLKVHPVGSSSLGIPKSIWYSAVSIALLLMAFHSLVNFLLVIRTGRPYVSEYFVLDEGATNQPKASDEQSPQNSEVTS